MRYLVAAKAYDAEHLRRSRRDTGAISVIPDRRNHERTIRYDKNRYCDRDLIENMFYRFADFLRIAIRYDKLAANFQSDVALATAFAFRLLMSH